MSKKILIIRFSSFGDIIQCMAAVTSIKEKYPNADIHWLTKSSFQPILLLNQSLKRVWSYNSLSGLKGLFKLGIQLRGEQFDLVYDAHQNIRSKILLLILYPFSRACFILRSKNRFKRFLLFKFRKNFLPNPFYAMRSFQEPLHKWGIESSKSCICSFNFSQEVKDTVSKLKLELNNQTIVIAPSAAWEMKRWPVEYWKELIEKLPFKNFIILGGSEDLFCQDLVDVDNRRVINMAGKLSLVESFYIVSKSSLFISGDTGLLHVADILGISGIALLGPSAFGHPTGSHIKVLISSLNCIPCSKDGRGVCSDEIYQKCMVKITPNAVIDLIL